MLFLYCYCMNHSISQVDHMMWSTMHGLLSMALMRKLSRQRRLTEVEKALYPTYHYWWECCFVRNANGEYQKMKDWSVTGHYEDASASEWSYNHHFIDEFAFIFPRTSYRLADVLSRLDFKI